MFVDWLLSNDRIFEMILFHMKTQQKIPIKEPYLNTMNYSWYYGKRTKEVITLLAEATDWLSRENQAKTNVDGTRDTTWLRPCRTKGGHRVQGPGSGSRLFTSKAPSCGNEDKLGCAAVVNEPPNSSLSSNALLNMSQSLQAFRFLLTIPIFFSGTAVLLLHSISTSPIKILLNDRIPH